MLNLSEALELAVVLVGVILVLKRIVDMDEYHIARVAVLTVILSVGAIMLINALAVRYGGFVNHSCVVEFDDPSITSDVSGQKKFWTTTNRIR